MKQLILYQWLKVLMISALVIAMGYLIVTRPLNLGLDLQGGMRLVLEAQGTQQLEPDTMRGTIQILQQRIDGLGVSEPVIRQKGLRQIIIELPGIRDTQRARDMVGQTAMLRFVAAQLAPNGVESMTPEQRNLLGGESSRLVQYNNQYVFLNETIMTGEHVRWAQATTGQRGDLGVDLELTDTGATLFHDATKRLIGRYIAILLDDRLISLPIIREPIPNGKAIISGDFTLDELKTLVIQLKTGALPVPLDIVSDTIIGPSLGKMSLQKSQKAGIIGLIGVMMMMIAVYRLSGALASLSLVVYGILVLGALTSINATLTLPSMAGIILTLGMAVDANVIIFERIRDERQAGHTVMTAISRGSARATATIIDANTTTLIGAGVLFWLGTGVIKGFAVTLTLGTIISMITALVLTQALLLLSAKRVSPTWLGL